MTQASIDQIWTWLDEVPDPEIPVISVVDLGIIRDVAWAADALQISVSPTYSGCPATRVIADDMRAALMARGIKNLKITQQISPPWTTDWITEKGRQALVEYGIAPPNPKGQPQTCPRCKGNDLERVSQFGSTPCKAQWRCKNCLEPFDYFKCI